ncbi:hypothetical protein C8D72_0107 [Kushneria indalinina DSM 14324]|uniref:Uncharacterized protein n=1 Tax=Kushneria indalinina DSM 14324 TaxID=1122140 RepID=A0A3D9DXF5_9GAMM|nr:hypothetical protein C8D72_0107 [Kushneria indalinina DSM 14324]
MMTRHQRNGLITLCLTGYISGCVSSPPQTTPVMVPPPPMPRYLTQPLPAPTGIDDIRTNQDLIILLTDYEQLRRRMNTDRESVQKLWEGMKLSMTSEIATKDRDIDEQDE